MRYLLFINSILFILACCYIVYLTRELNVLSAANKNIGQQKSVNISDKRYFLVSVSYNKGYVLRSWGWVKTNHPTRKEIEEFIEKDGGENVAVTGIYEFKSRKEYDQYFDN